MSLSDLAAQMTGQPEGQLQDRLGDLQLAYLRLGDKRKLRIGREGLYPSVEQLRAVLDAFHVPAEPVITPGRMKSQAPHSGRWYTLLYYDVQWRDHTRTVARNEGGR